MDIGHALFTAQETKTDPSAKPMKGFGGARVLEIVACVASRVYSAFSGRHLCFARISKKVDKGNRHTDAGDQFNQAAARGSRTRLPGKAELK
jgi:hypothetical protein